MGSRESVEIIKGFWAAKVELDFFKTSCDNP